MLSNISYLAQSSSSNMLALSTLEPYQLKDNTNQILPYNILILLTFACTMCILTLIGLGIIWHCSPERENNEEESGEIELENINQNQNINQNGHYTPIGGFEALAMDEV